MAFWDFFNDIFMIKEQKSYVGLTGMKRKSNSKKSIVKSVKKSETRLSDLMRREHKSRREREITAN